MEQQDKGENAKAFLVNSACIRCGICVKVCPANNITLEKQIKFHDKCESCYACIHACPQNAIHLENEKSNVRWRNPEITLEELIQSNQ
ncbi:EFR1 family ferrodoxin [Mordavella massiliensis]|uniref:EFR1 family ferrodoxin n=1 Tax=Mordavella massiliensis TaxID=1871024 RepID=UPI00370982CC